MMKWTDFTTAFAFCAALLVSLGATTVRAADAPADITGKWKGIGYVQKDESSRPVKVRCAIEGKEAGDEISFEGSCRAMLIMKRDIGAWLTRDGESFTGTYKGADAGIAQLDGRETEPRRLELTMTFPRLVHTDDKAIMTIVRPDNNNFSITTTDVMTTGEEIVTSSIDFERESKVSAR